MPNLRLSPDVPSKEGHMLKPSEPRFLPYYERSIRSLDIVQHNKRPNEMKTTIRWKLQDLGHV